MFAESASPLARLWLTVDERTTGVALRAAQKYKNVLNSS